MTLKVGVVNVTVHKNIGNSVAHGFADAQLALRAALRCAFFLVSARHFEKSPCHARA